MKLTQHYLNLKNRYTLIGEREPLSVEVTVDEVAEALDCTHRNTVLILHKMADHGWIEWKPFRGRAKRSSLVFLIPSEQITLERAKELIEKKNLRGALELMNKSANASMLKESFHDWLDQYFGYSTELHNSIKIDQLRFPLSQPIETLDPLYINLSSESHMVNQIFDGLLRHDRLKQTFTPHIAHAWETDAARTCWTFYLRKGILFHHGREMTSRDVKYSLLRLRDSQNRSLYRWIHTNIAHIETPDPTTVQIYLHRPNELFLPFLATNRASIVPEDLCEAKKEQFGVSPVGTGPFKYTADNGSISVLEASPYYFMGRAHLDRVEIWHIPDLQEHIQRRNLNEFQLIHNFKMTEAAKSENWQQIEQLGTICKFITFNTSREGPLKNPAVRRALYHLVDRDAVIGTLGGASLSPASGFVSENHSLKEPLTSKQALAILKQAGYDINNSNEPIHLCTIPPYEPDALAVQAVCKSVGISVSITLLPPEDFKGELRLKADLILFALMMDNDLELRMIDVYKSMQSHLEPEVNLMLENKINELLKEPSPQNRMDLFRDIEFLLKSNYTLLFLYNKPLHTLHHPSVKGISLDSLGWVHFKDIWFKSRKG